MGGETTRKKRAVQSCTLQFTLFALRFKQRAETDASIVNSKSSMSTRVKICGITNVPDALAAAEAGADMIGLMFYESSPRCVTLETGREISRALPPYVLSVGVFVNPDPAFVDRAIAGCGLSLLQFHGDETSDFCTQFGLLSLKALRMRDAQSLTLLEPFKTSAFLLDAYSPGAPGGTGETFNWDLAVAAQKFRQTDFSRRWIDAGKRGVTR
jgi:phosphoribosylanthranilate isomerase